METTIPGAAPAVALVVGDGAIALWHVPPLDRLKRELRPLRMEVCEDIAELPGGAAVVALRADIAYDPALLRTLRETPDLALTMPDGVEIAGFHAVGPTASKLAADLASGSLTAKMAAAHGLKPQLPSDAGAYRSALRKREAPYLLPVSRESRPRLERRLFGASYKGVTDVVTKYVWPEPAYWVTQACARLGLGPNLVTFASLLLVLVAFYLFAQGQFAAGLVAAWLMTFLDTVDGKLARVTVTYTRFGGAFDHAIDLIHPPFWYWAWIIGLESSGAAPANADILLGIIVGGYVLQRAEEGAFLARHRIEMHVWRRFDSLFRLVTARRNPNLIILTVSLLMVRPGMGIAAVAAWTALCFLVHLARLVQAETERRHGRLTSWLDR